MRFLGANSNPQLVGKDEQPNQTNYFIGSDPRKWRTRLPNYGRVEYRDLYPGIDLVYHGSQRRLEYDLVLAPGARPDAIHIAFDGIEELRLDNSGDLILKTRQGELRQAKPLAYQETGGERRPVTAEYVRLGRREVGFRVADYDPHRPLVVDPVLSYSTYLGGSADDVGYAIAVDGGGNAYVTGSTLSLDFPTRRSFQREHGLNFTVEDAFVTKINSSGSALVYSTYLGGGDYDIGRGIAVDASGNAYVTGYTASTEFPTLHPFQPERSAYPDAFITKLNATGTALIYSSYLGGNREDSGYAIAADGFGNAYVTGDTSSTDFPTRSAFQWVLAGGYDAFVTKITPSGRIVYSSYLGGSSDESGKGVAVDTTHHAYMTGTTSSTDFPTQNALQPNFGGGSDAFVAKISPLGSALVYSSYLAFGTSEEGHGIAVDTPGNAYIVGTTLSRYCQFGVCSYPKNGFVAKMDLATPAFVYGASLFCFSISQNPPPVYGSGIAVDSSGNAYVTGSTACKGFPTKNPFQAAGGASDAFVAKINVSGRAFIYSSKLGGSGNEYGNGIAVDSSGNAYVTGSTGSIDFPTEAPFQRAFGGGNSDAFVARIAEAFVPAALSADPSAAASSDGNGVFEPGETVLIETSWTNPRTVGVTLAGSAPAFTGPSGAIYSIPDRNANYGVIAANATGSCAATPDCYSMTVSVPARRPATHWDSTFTEILRGAVASPPPKTWTLHLGDSFTDVPRSHPFYEKIETLLHSGITTGCSAAEFCSGQTVSRAQITMFLARAIAGGGPNVPPTGDVNGAPYNCQAGGVSLFIDVAPINDFCKHVHYLAARNIDSGCGPGLYCPGDTVTRLSMAGFVANALVAPGGDAAVPLTYGPDPATGFSYSCDVASPKLQFNDVPASDPYCRPVHYLWAKGIISGCGADAYCPTGDVTRDQMAKFLVNAFQLKLYGP